MNEQERINSLNANVDALLRGKMPDENNDSLLNIAGQLTQTDFSTESAIRETLRQELLNRVAQKKEKSLHHQQNHSYKLVFAAAVLLVFTTLVFAIPSVRTLAQEVLTQIGFIIFTNEETPFQRYLQGTPIPTSIPIPRDQQLPILTSGLPAYLPKYVSDGYQIDSKSSNGESAIYIKGEPGKSPLNVHYNLVIQQQSSDRTIASFAVDDARVINIFVRGQPGLWIEQAPIGAQVADGGGLKPLNVNILVWEENKTTFSIHNLVVSSDDSTYSLLSLDEMLKIAESLSPTK